MSDTMYLSPEECCPNSSPNTIGERFSRMVEWIQSWRRSRRDIQHLRAMADHHLKDVGIRRSEIESIVYGKSWDHSRRRGVGRD